jgi:hypothetical protein
MLTAIFLLCVIFGFDDELAALLLPAVLSDETVGLAPAEESVATSALFPDL